MKMKVVCNIILAGGATGTVYWLVFTDIIEQSLVMTLIWGNKNSKQILSCSQQQNVVQQFLENKNEIETYKH